MLKLINFQINSIKQLFKFSEVKTFKSFIFCFIYYFFTIVVAILDGLGALLLVGVFLKGPIVEISNTQTMATVYIPTAPTPNSGFVVMVPYKEVQDTDLTVQEAMSMVLSGGIIAPESFNKKSITSEDVEKIDSADNKIEG